MFEKYYRFRIKQLKKKCEKYKKEIKLYESRKNKLSAHDYKFIMDFIYEEIDNMEMKIIRLNKKIRRMKREKISH